LENISDECPSTENFLMTTEPIRDANNRNLLRFSSCSIKKFKTTLLTDDKSSVSFKGSCLQNSPEQVPSEVSQTDYHYPGQIWTADDQCKLVYGQNSTFCRVSIVFFFFNFILFYFNLLIFNRTT
jgi:hypothetical protein